MENFFWRIWSNRNIHTSLSGNHVGRLFGTFAHDAGQVTALQQTVTTTQESDTTSTEEGTQAVTPQAHLEGSPHQPPTLPTVSLEVPGVEDEALAKPLETSGSHLHPDRHTSRNAASQGSLSSDDSNATATGSSTRRSSSIIEEPTSSQKASKRQQSRKKPRATTPAPSGGKPKIRPPIHRKRSSQGSVQSSKKSPAVSPRIKPLGSKNAAKPKGSPPQSPSLSISPRAQDKPGFDPKFSLESSSWQDSSPSPPKSFDAQPFTKPSSWLVEEGFRSRFEDQKRRNTSHGNIPSLGKSASVRFMEELPDKGRGKHRYSEVDTQGNVIRESFSGPGSIDSGNTIIRDFGGDDSGEGPSGIARTTSQLSLMISRERKISGTLPPEPAATADESVDPVRPPPSSSQEDDEEEDGEALVLGMGVGAKKYPLRPEGNEKGKGKGKAEDEGGRSDYGSPPARPTW